MSGSTEDVDATTGSRYERSRFNVGEGVKSLQRPAGGRVESGVELALGGDP